MSTIKNVNTIRVDDATKMKLNKYGAFLESYQNVLNKVLDACDVLDAVKYEGESLVDVARRLIQEASLKKQTKEPQRLEMSTPV